MPLLVTRALAAACLCLALIHTVSAFGEHRLHRDPVNAFKIFDLFPEAVAVYTSSHDPSLECLTAKRSLYQPNKRVAYTWSLKGHGGSQKGEHVLTYFPGPSKDTVIGIANRDTKHPLHVKYDYTNNKNCVVANFPYKGEVCILWVRSEVVADVPQECIDQYQDICSDKVPAYHEDQCKNDLDVN
ncbi:uncharacterized protein LOC144103624 [Amblyomma americanum]